jgi:hypothetical protein
MQSGGPCSRNRAGRVVSGIVSRFRLRSMAMDSLEYPSNAPSDTGATPRADPIFSPGRNTGCSDGQSTPLLLAK